MSSIMLRSLARRAAGLRATPSAGQPTARVAARAKSGMAAAATEHGDAAAEAKERARIRFMGHNFLSEANDLKRPLPIVATELGVPLEVLEAFTQGEVDTATATSLIQQMAETYPVPLGDLLIEQDDTDGGVVVFPKEASEASARVLSRLDRDGERTPYYEYRDAAMSRIGPFRPEWIKELREVHDNDPHNPDIAMNNGHFMLQTTFFIGPVNFYYEVDGERHVMVGDTGDTNFISPFCPHSFAHRYEPERGDNQREAIIIAVTYGGLVRQALSDFSRVGAGTVAGLSGDLRDGSAYQVAIERNLANEAMSVGCLASRLTDAGMPAERAAELADGKVQGSLEETAAVARALNVRLSDILVEPLEYEDEVVTQYRGAVPTRPFGDAANPSYSFEQLARTRHQADLKSFAITVHADEGGDHAAAEIETGLHQFLFNVGDHAAVLRYGFGDDKQEKLLGPGDSAFIAPSIPHTYTNVVAGAEAEIYAVRIAGKITTPVLTEFASFQPEGRKRVGAETSRWYN